MTTLKSKEVAQSNLFTDIISSEVGLYTNLAQYPNYQRV